MAGDSILRLTAPPDPPAHDGGAGELMSATVLRYLTLMVTDMDEALRAIEEHGGNLAIGPMRIGRRTTIAQVRGPDGNWIELVQEA